MSAVMIRERMTDYAAVLNDVVAVLEAPRQQVTRAEIARQSRSYWMP